MSPKLTVWWTHCDWSFCWCFWFTKTLCAALTSGCEKLLWSIQIQNVSNLTPFYLGKYSVRKAFSVWFWLESGNNARIMITCLFHCIKACRVPWILGIAALCSVSKWKQDFQGWKWDYIMNLPRLWVSVQHRNLQSLVHLIISHLTETNGFRLL